MLSRDAAQRRDNITEDFLLPELDAEWVHMNLASTVVLLDTYSAKIFFERRDRVIGSPVSQSKSNRINQEVLKERASFPDSVVNVCIVVRREGIFLSIGRTQHSVDPQHVELVFCAFQ